MLKKKHLEATLLKRDEKCISSEKMKTVELNGRTVVHISIERRENARKKQVLDLDTITGLCHIMTVTHTLRALVNVYVRLTESMLVFVILSTLLKHQIWRQISAVHKKV